jgi:hypothetical protein
MEALELQRKGELSIREIALPTEVAVLKPKLNEPGPRRYQPGGYYRSFANYRPPSFEVDTKNYAVIRSGDSVIARFWDCQKKSFRLWRVLKR